MKSWGLEHRAARVPSVQTEVGVAARDASLERKDQIEFAQADLEGSMHGKRNMRCGYTRVEVGHGRIRTADVFEVMHGMQQRG